MRNIEIVELLLDKGAKVSAVDKVQLFGPLLCQGAVQNEADVGGLTRKCLWKERGVGPVEKGVSKTTLYVDFTLVKTKWTKPRGISYSKGITQGKWMRWWGWMERSHFSFWGSDLLCSRMLCFHFLVRWLHVVSCRKGILRSILLSVAEAAGLPNCF